MITVEQSKLLEPRLNEYSLKDIEKILERLYEAARVAIDSYMEKMVPKIGLGC